MLLSIAIAVYNGEDYLPQMVDSILSQSYRDFELLLLDDGSTDGSSAICDRYAEEDVRVRVVHKENAGLCATRNLAIELAKGSYISFMDQDDMVLPGTLERFADAMDQDTADFYLNGFYFHIENSKGKVIERRPILASDAWLKNACEVRQFYIEHLSDSLVSPIWNMFFSMDYLRSTGLRFDEGLRMSLDDLEFNARSYFAAQHVRVISHLGMEYYVRTNASSSRRYNPQFLSQCVYVLGKLNMQMLSAGMTSSEERGAFYRCAARLIIITGLQSLIYSRKQLGEDKLKKEIETYFQEPMVKEIVDNLIGDDGMSRYERMILDCVRERREKRLTAIIVCKDIVRQKHFRPLIKKLVG